MFGAPIGSFQAYKKERELFRPCPVFSSTEGK